MTTERQPNRQPNRPDLSEVLHASLAGGLIATEAIRRIETQADINMPKVPDDQPGIIPPAVRSVDDFQPGDRVEYFLPNQSQAFVPGIVLRLTEEYVIIQTPSELMAVFCVPEHFGLWKADDIDHINNSRLEGTLGGYTPMYYLARIQLEIKPSTDRNDVNKICRYFGTNLYQMSGE